MVGSIEAAVAKASEQAGEAPPEDQAESESEAEAAPVAEETEAVPA
jgi:hypothetical protein